MKKINFFIAALLCSLVFNSCKKNDTAPVTQLTDTAPFANLKSWYKTAITNQSAGSGVNAKNAGIPDWKNTQTSADRTTYLTPLSVKGLKGHYKAILSKTDKSGTVLSEKYVYLLIDAKHNKEVPSALLNIVFFQGNVTTTAFTGALVEYDLQNRLLGSRHFENGKLIPSKTDDISNPKPTTTGRASAQSAGSNCTDWYWVTREDGVVIDSEYLYTTCNNNDEDSSDPGGPGGGGGDQSQDPDADCQQLQIDMQSMSHTVTNHSSSVMGAITIENNEQVAPKSSKGSAHSYTIGWYKGEWVTYYTGKISRSNANTPWKWKEFAFDSFMQTGASSLPPTVTATATASISTAISGDKSLASANGTCHVLLSSSCFNGTQLGGFDDPVYESFTSQ